MDQMHLDLWIDGINVFCDSGSYSYASEQGDLLTLTEAHNTVFVKGTPQFVRNGRFFTYLTEKSFGELLKTVPELVIEKLWISADVRAERGEERWLNIVLRKQV